MSTDDDSSVMIILSNDENRAGGWRALTNEATRGYFFLGEVFV